MKSSAADLADRGFLSEGQVNAEGRTDAQELAWQLKSQAAVERTEAAIIIRRKSLISLIPELIEALSEEKKLYSKIELQKALAGFGEESIEPLIPVLGAIGSNQHRSLPSKPFNKNSYPLPRDIAARTLVKIKSSVIPRLLSADLLRRQLLEAVDVIGHISFYSRDDEAIPFLLRLYHESVGDALMQWKVIRAFSAGQGNNVTSLLNDIVNQSLTEQHVWEAARSLRLITQRS